MIAGMKDGCKIPQYKPLEDESETEYHLMKGNMIRRKRLIKFKPRKG